jgi:hypothetical protein
VTDADKGRFKVAFNRLAVATRLSTNEIDPAMQLVFFDGLKDLTIEAVESAARTLEKTAVWFPKVAEWRAAAHVARFEARLKALPPVTRENGLTCERCQDTGFELRTCEAGARCGKARCVDQLADYTHSYAIACACRETNAAYQRDRLTTFSAVPFDPRMAAAGKDE